MSTDVQVYQGNALDVDLIRRTIAPNLKRDEFDLFITRCRQTGLDPIARQIYALSVWDSQLGGNKMSIQTSIDGFRLLAERTGKYEGQVGPFWCDESGEWKDVWVIEDKPPIAAKVGVYKAGFREPLYAVAHYRDFVKRNNKTGDILGQWKSMPAVMIAKVAESHAIRRAFPAETSGLYTREEMMQAENTLPAQALAHESVINAEVTDVSESNGQKKQTPATEQQITSIRKLLQHLGKPEEIREDLRYLEAKEIIVELSRQYNDQRQKKQPEKSVETDKNALPPTDPIIQRMIDIAKSRVAKIGMDWEAVKQEALKRVVADHEVKIGDFVHINGLITKHEKATRGAA